MKQSCKLRRNIRSGWRGVESAMFLWVGVVILINVISLPHRAVSQTTAPHTVAQRTPANLLSLLGMDASLTRMLRDGQPLGDEDAEPLVRLLFLLPRLDAMDLHRWREVATANLDACQSDPDQHRLTMVSVAGQVSSISQVALLPEIVDRFGFQSYFRIQFTNTTGDHPIELCVRQLPRSWQSGAVPLQGMPIRADAFFLKMSTQASGHPQWTLVADRIAWHPHEPDAALNVTAGAAALGARGMDISRFDDVVQGQPLVQEDREAFYQLLWTVRRLPTSSETPAEMQLQRELGTLITRPKQVPGERLRVTGTARRALRVRVPDADINARFGIDHYYEVDIAVPLEQVLVLRDPQDGQELQYGATFPVTLCLAELPNGMPLGDDIRQAI